MIPELFRDFPEEPLITRVKVADFVFSHQPSQWDKETRIREMMCETSALQREKLDLILQILKHPEFQRLIEEGHITLAAVKPHTEKTFLPEKIEGVTDDISGEKAVLGLVKSPLQNIFQVSFALTPKDLQSFYPGLKERIPPPNWKIFKKSMLSGPVTYVLLYCDECNAIDEWRSQIGPTNPDKAREDAPNSLRAKYAKTIDNNVVHGSANIGDAKMEIGWLTGKIQCCLEIK